MPTVFNLLPDIFLHNILSNNGDRFYSSSAMPVAAIRKATVGQVCLLNFIASVKSNEPGRMESAHSFSNARDSTSTTATGLVAPKEWSNYFYDYLVRLFLTTHSSFLAHTLPKFARQNPQIEINVAPRPQKHPVIRGHYVNGREKAICVRNLEADQIMKKAELLRDASGEKLRKVTKPVKSINESVRGIWSPYHGGGIAVWDGIVGWEGFVTMYFYKFGIVGVIGFRGSRFTDGKFF